MGMIFYSVVAGKMPYDSSVESLELAHQNKARPEIDARLDQRFMEVSRFLKNLVACIFVYLFQVEEYICV